MSLSRSRNSRRIARKHEGILTAAIEGVGRPSYIAITLHNEVGLLLPSLLLQLFRSRRERRESEKSSHTNPPAKELLQLKRGPSAH